MTEKTDRTPCFQITDWLQLYVTRTTPNDWYWVGRFAFYIRHSTSCNQTAIRNERKTQSPNRVFPPDISDIWDKLANNSAGAIPCLFHYQLQTVGTRRKIIQPVTGNIGFYFCFQFRSHWSHEKYQTCITILLLPAIIY